MSICKHCSGVGGFHRQYCPTQETRIEITGNIEVHHPIRPTVHTAAKEFAVMCA